MTRYEMISTIALNIAKQAIKSGNHKIDLTWLDTDALLEEIEQHMSPKYGGKHQTSYDLAMGTRPEWDKDE